MVHPHPKFTPRPLFLALIICASLFSGCAPEPTTAPGVDPTTIAGCFPESVFTAEDMRARVECHPDDYKLVIDEDTVVLFAFPDPLLDWVGPVFVIHIPSVSEAVLGVDGTLMIADYKSSEGQTAIEGVLNNPDLMSGILGRSKEIMERSP